MDGVHMSNNLKSAIDVFIISLYSLGGREWKRQTRETVFIIIGTIQILSMYLKCLMICWPAEAALGAIQAFYGVHKELV